MRTTVEATAEETAGVLAFTFEEGGEQTLTIDLARTLRRACACPAGRLRRVDGRQQPRKSGCEGVSYLKLPAVKPDVRIPVIEVVLKGTVQE